MHFCHQHRPPPPGEPPPVCDICFEPVVHEEPCATRCCRRHTTYHRGCIERWLEVCPTCPNCRRPRPPVVRRGGGDFGIQTLLFWAALVWILVV